MKHEIEHDMQTLVFAYRVKKDYDVIEMIARIRKEPQEHSE